jgi:predicted nucleic acid-binding Zn ribbon protein
MVSTPSQRHARRRGRRSEGLKAVGDLLPELAEKGGWGALVELSRLQARWAEVVGEQIAAHTAPERIQHGRLTVLVDSSAWLMQLSFYKADIHRKVNAHLGGERVSEVFLKVGRTHRSAGPEKRAADPPPSPETVATVEGWVAEVPDDAVRDALKRLLLRDLRRPARPRSN